MKLSHIQKGILEVLKESPKTIAQLEIPLGRSHQTIRNAMLTLEASEYVERDDSRQPHLFLIATKQGIDRALVDSVKAKLIKPSKADKEHMYLAPLFLTKKPLWGDAADTFKVLALAIEELSAEGKLVETLEDETPAGPYKPGATK